MTASTSQAALAVNLPEGRCARAELFRSAWTCSMIACPRWVLSAATVSRSAGSVVVKNAWKRQVSNNVSCPSLPRGFRSGMRRTTSRPGTCSVSFFGGERGEGHLGDLGPRHPGPEACVEDGVGVLDGGPRVLFDGGDRGLDLGVQAHGDRHLRPTADRCTDRRCPIERRVRTQQRLAVTGPCSLLTVLRASATSRFAPRGDPHDPLRSRCATTTGADPRGGDGGEQRVQAAHPGVAEPGALLGVPVDLDDRVVDIDQHPTARAVAGDLRGLAGRASGWSGTSRRPRRAGGRDRS